VKWGLWWDEKTSVKRQHETTSVDVCCERRESNDAI
jgi:hypothetical protein